MQNITKILESVERSYKERFLFYAPHPKQSAFHEAGKHAKERFFLAGNRTGKTMCAVIETAMHLTGNYPDWWNGYRYKVPVDVWVASNTAQTTRDIIQKQYYFGRSSLASVSSVSPERFCREFGVIPHHLILRTVKSRGGSSDSIDTVEVLHSSGGVSTLGFKAYDQGRERFQGTRKDIIHFDEEPHYDVYLEALIRTMGTHPDHYGMVMTTMTPKKGMTQMVSSFYLKIDEGVPQDDRFYIQASWEDNPHLQEQERERLARNLSPSDKDAVKYGLPSFGSGMVYPCDPNMVIMPSQIIPKHWGGFYGMDFGWTNPTALVFCAINPENDVIYVYDEYKESKRTPHTHKEFLRSKGVESIWGAYDPSGDNRSAHEGEQLSRIYKDLGFKLRAADNAKEAGIQKVLQRLQSGRLRIFSNCVETIAEMKAYARDDHGHPMKKNDHLMDALRYAVVTGVVMASASLQQSNFQKRVVNPHPQSWLGN